MKIKATNAQEFAQARHTAHYGMNGVGTATMREQIKEKERQLKEGRVYPSNVERQKLSIEFLKQEVAERDAFWEQAVKEYEAMDANRKAILATGKLDYETLQLQDKEQADRELLESLDPVTRSLVESGTIALDEVRPASEPQATPEVSEELKNMLNASMGLKA